MRPHRHACGRYQRTSERLPHHTVIAIILYLDGTQATRKISGQSAKPVVLTLGNFKIPVMNKGCAKRVLTYMPSAKATAKVIKSSRADWLLSRRLVYHEAWRQILAPLVGEGQTQSDGRFFSLDRGALEEEGCM